ncbi:response regulator, partial [Planctomicrobium sp.]|nr:response regulator [Planctomicrobium sp.]
DMDDSRALAARVGADGYMTKPYDPDDLLEQIHIIAEEVWKQRHLGSKTGDSEKVRFSCGECGKKLKVKASHRGRTLNCPRCGQPAVVPMHD